MENIDHIFYINLDKRQDRRVEIDAELSKQFSHISGIPEKIERFAGIEAPPKKGIVGCTQSHLEVLKLAKERGYTNVLIFEDDFVFEMSPKEFETGVQAFFDLNIEYDVLMFAYNLEQSADTQYPFLKKALAAATASCYLVNNTMYDPLINMYTNAIPLLDTTMYHWLYANDQIWKQLQPQSNWYCFNPRAGRQRPGYSDNSDTYMDFDH